MFLRKEIHSSLPTTKQSALNHIYISNILQTQQVSYSYRFRTICTYTHTHTHTSTITKSGMNWLGVTWEKMGWRKWKLGNGVTIFQFNFLANKKWMFYYHWFILYKIRTAKSVEVELRCYWCTQVWGFKCKGRHHVLASVTDIRIFSYFAWFSPILPFWFPS